MNEIEKLTELEKRISDLEREEYKNWKRISELEKDAGKSAGKLTKEERGFTKNYEAFSNLKTGTWIRLDTWQIENHTYMIDRNYINFAGETGTIVKNEVEQILSSAYPIGETRQYIELKMDKHFPALDEFNNCLLWEIEERLRFDGDNALFVECEELIPSFDILLDSGKTIDGTGYGIKPRKSNDQENIRKIRAEMELVDKEDV